MHDDGEQQTSSFSGRGDGRPDELSASDRRVKQSSAGPRRSGRQRTRGWSDEGPRSERIAVYFTEQEFADIDAVCARLGMKPGAWVAEMAVRYSRGQLEPIPADWRDVVREFVSARTDVVRVGTLLNQIAKHANSLGEFEEETGRLLAMVDRMLSRVDSLEAEASDRVGRAR